MKLALTLALSLSSLAPAALALACDGEHETMSQVTVPEATKLQKAKSATFVDANGKETRKKMGVIPGAILLTSSSEFDADKELPAKKDSKLIFYCANTHCSASGAAAARAKEAGYTNVAVLPDGIKGWRDAGLPTTSKADNS